MLYTDLKEETLDPQDWKEMRSLGHKMLDDMFDYLENIRQEPAWRKPTEGVIQSFEKPLPQEGEEPQHIYNDFLNNILPYNKGNVHPRFFSWVEGNGTPLGMLADLLASGMNPNTTIGNHAAMYVERQVIEWAKEMFGFPKEASGMLISGASLANITAIQVARNNFQGLNIRAKGLQNIDKQLIMYASAETHNCLRKAAETIGIGNERLRMIAVDEDYKIRIDLLEAQIEADIADGLTPFCIIGNAGTVNTGSIDPLSRLREICDKYGMWFHVDGAFGALARLTEEFAEALKPIELADSLAFDFHKWMYVNYESSCFLIRDRQLNLAAFAYTPNYLTAHERGLASGIEPFNNFGMELSRNFKALKVWMSLREHGIKKYGRLIQQNINQARYLADLVKREEHLELMAPVPLNIVCFRFNDKSLKSNDLNILNKEILMELHERGIATPSYTILNGQYAIRTNITNHRTRWEDLDLLIKSVIEIGHEILNKNV